MLQLFMLRIVFWFILQEAGLSIVRRTAGYNRTGLASDSQEKSLETSLLLTRADLEYGLAQVDDTVGPTPFMMG